jgi:hypothetical protein
MIVPSPSYKPDRPHNVVKGICAVRYNGRERQQGASVCSCQSWCRGTVHQKFRTCRHCICTALTDVLALFMHLSPIFPRGRESRHLTLVMCGAIIQLVCPLPLLNVPAVSPPLSYFSPGSPHSPFPLSTLPPSRFLPALSLQPMSSHPPALSVRLSPLAIAYKGICFIHHSPCWYILNLLAVSLVFFLFLPSLATLLSSPPCPLDYFLPALNSQLSPPFFPFRCPISLSNPSLILPALLFSGCLARHFLVCVAVFFFFFFFEPIYIPEYKPETKPGRSYEPLHLETKVN